MTTRSLRLACAITSVLGVTVSVAHAVLPQTPEELAIAEAKAFTVDALCGTQHAFSWTYEDWVGPITEDGQVGVDPIGTHLAPLIDFVPGLTFDLQQVPTRVTHVTTNCPRDAERKWTFSNSIRVVQRFEECYRTEYVSADNSIFAYGNDAICLVGAPQLDLLTFTNSDRRAMGVKGLGADVLFPLPEVPLAGGTWIQTTMWNATVGDVNGAQRVLLVAASGFGEDPLADYVLLFEKQLGVLVPVIQYQRDEFGVTLMALEYSAVNHPQGGQVPFPTKKYCLQRSDDGLSLNLEVGSMQKLPSPASRAELKIMVDPECGLSFHSSILSATELQTVRPGDILTWPQRVLDAIIVL